MAGHLAHDSFRSVLSCLADLDLAVAHGREDIWQDLNDVRLENTAKSDGECFHSKQRTLASIDVLLVLESVLQTANYVEFLESRDASPFDDPSQTASSK